MCGIAGFFRWGTQTPVPETLARLWAIQESRGKDAAGVAWMKGQSVFVRKNANPARDVARSITKEEWAQIIESPFALFHARAQTKGDKKDPENNHPVAGKHTVVVHNGMVQNDDDLFEHFSPTERFAAVDTAAINLLLEQGNSFEEGLRHLTLLGGSATFAAWSHRAPTQIVLGRIGFNELWVFYEPSRNILYWSTVPTAAQLFVYQRLASIPLVLTSRVVESRLLLLSPDGPDATRAFQVNSRPYGRRRVVVTPYGQGYTPPMQSGPLVVTPHVTKLETKAQNGPPPQLPEPGRFAWDDHDLWKAQRKAREENTKVVLVTGLGRWTFEFIAGEVFRSFRPFKGTKKWWHKELGAVPTLPLATDSSLQNTLRLVPLVAHEQLSSKAVWVSKGLVCPLCGAWARELTWLRAEGKCQLCLTKSIIPHGV